MYTCKHGCGYEHTHRGAMNTHESIHCKTLKKEEEKKQGSSTAQMKKKKRGCEHEWRLLSRREEQILLSHGKDEYAEICSKCKELR